VNLVSQQPKRKTESPYGGTSSLSLDLTSMFGLLDRAHRPSGVLCFSDAKPERLKVNAVIAVSADNGVHPSKRWTTPGTGHDR
jgi:hypothetical protein